MTTAVGTLLLLAAAHLALGGAFAVVFLAKGLPRLDYATRDAGRFFRLLILPGVVALWPWLAVKWRRAGDAGFAGGAETPVSPRTQRWLHSLLVKLLVVLLPLVFAAGLYFRVKESPASSLPRLARPSGSVPAK